MRVRASIVLLALTSSCRSCTTPATTRTDDADRLPVRAGSDATAASDASASAIDAEPIRRRARVPAIAWASVTRDGAIAGAVGHADATASVIADASTVFEAASIAKTVIATCVLQLVDARRVSLDADVSSYVGFAVRNPRPHGAGTITLRHLLTHTASIIDGPATDSNPSVPLEDLLRAHFAPGSGSAGVFLDASPGTTMLYSNVGPSLAALAVERVSGVHFAEYARAHVFLPLAMTTARFGRDTVPTGVAIASAYVARGANFVRVSATAHALYPVVDLFASASDLGRYARAILRGGELDGARILSASSVDTMLRVQLPDAAPDDGLGWQSRVFGTHHVFGHEGEDRGASTALYLDAHAGSGAVVLTNGDAFQGEDHVARTAAIGAFVETLLDEAHAATMRGTSVPSPDPH